MNRREMLRRSATAAVPIATLGIAGALAQPEADADGRPYRLRADDSRARTVKAVRLNGRRIKYCSEFDRRAGWVRVLKQDRSGKPYITGGELAEHVLYGDVDVEWTD